MKQADHSWSPWWGCRKVSPGCAHCYAESLATRFGHDCFGDSPRRMLSASHWSNPLAWDRKAATAGKRGFVFPSMCDVFEDAEDMRDGELVECARAGLWTLIAVTPHLTWLLLTKRPENVRAMVPWKPGEWPRNAWLGFTAEDQERLDERYPHAEDNLPPVLFLSHEPGLGPLALDLMRLSSLMRRIDWVITGGESGPHARPYDLAWPRDLIRQCRDAEVPVFVKQLGARPWDTDGLRGHEWKLTDRRAGADPSEWPADLQVQQRPDPKST